MTYFFTAPVIPAKAGIPSLSQRDSGFRRNDKMWSMGFLLAAFCLLASPAFAQGYYNSEETPPAADEAEAADSETAPASHMVVVTSIEKCYAQLGHAEAIDIERNYIKPYQECQRRLALKTRQQQEIKVGQKKSAVPSAAPSAALANPPAAQNPVAPQSPPHNPGSAAPQLSDQGLYYRVQKNALPPPPPPVEEKPDSNADADKPSPAVRGLNR